MNTEKQTDPNTETKNKTQPVTPEVNKHVANDSAPTSIPRKDGMRDTTAEKKSGQVERKEGEQSKNEPFKKAV